MRLKPAAWIVLNHVVSIIGKFQELVNDKIYGCQKLQRNKSSCGSALGVMLIDEVSTNEKVNQESV